MISRIRKWLLADMGGIVLAIVTAVSVVAWLTKGPF